MYPYSIRPFEYCFRKSSECVMMTFVIPLRKLENTVLVLHHSIKDHLCITGSRIIPKSWCTQQQHHPSTSVQVIQIINTKGNTFSAYVPVFSLVCSPAGLGPHMPDPSILPSAARLPSLMSVCPRDEQCCNRLCSLSVRVILSLGEIHPASSLPTEERVETTPHSTFNLFSLLSHFLSLLGGKILISIHTILEKNFSCASSSTIHLWLGGLVVVSNYVSFETWEHV